MDIQNVVTSIMPGLMGNIPWPRKLRSARRGCLGGKPGQILRVSIGRARKRLRSQARLLPASLSGREDSRQPGDTRRLLADLEKLARAQNEVGKVTLQDVLRAQIEQDRLRTEIANLEDSRRALLAQFKAALGLKPRTRRRLCPRGSNPRRWT